jgi:imidazolonepropionase-like amidohydrolase
LMKENGAFFTPTMTVYDALHQIFAHIDNMKEAPLFKKSEFRYVPHEIMSEWTNPENEEFKIVMSVKGLSSIKEMIPESARREEFINVSKKIVKAFHDAGVPMMVGSDSSDPGVVWGFSLHRELELFVEAGLTPFEALVAATRVPSEFLKSGAGTIEVGKRADLVLFPENPLEDIKRTSRNDGVMVRGKWFSRRELEKMLEETEAKNKAEAAEVV